MGIYENGKYTREIIPDSVPFIDYGQYIINNFHHNPIMDKLAFTENNYPETSDVSIDAKKIAKRLFISSCFYIFDEKATLKDLSEEKRRIVENVRLDVDVDIIDVIEAFPEFSDVFNRKFKSIKIPCK